MPKTAASQSATYHRPLGTTRAEMQTEPAPLSSSTSPGSHPGATLGAACTTAGKKGCSMASFETWPPGLDRTLQDILASTPGGERAAITAVRAMYPELPEELIWSRIVYLGLTNRKRPPYCRHEWTAVEDEILRNEYGRSRTSSHHAIEKILAMHPDWNRDAVIWRARTLGLTQSRQRPYQLWTSARDHLLLSLQGCQPDTIAKRLGCTKESALGRLRRLDWGADFFGGFKTKDLVRDLRVPETAVERWVRLGWLQRKKGRITEESLRWLCQRHPEEIPFETLAPEARNWLVRSLGYARATLAQSSGRTKA